ncbi:MAG: choice-of-anchor B domain-containing protein [Limisphaerales bacterium]|jgi:choice-of-anchor B domain-containing protein
MRISSRLILSTLLLSLLSVSGFSQLNVSFLGQVTYGNELSDIWGYHDAVNNREYALVGVFNGLSVVDVTVPTAPVQVQFVPGINSIWRDIKVWGDHAYVTNESGNGVLICDLSNLPSSMPTSLWDGGVGLSSAHNIFIDENGIGYICGSNGGLGTLFIDIDADPMDPPVLGSYTTRYVHDLFVRGDTMWTAEISDGIFSVIDVSDKSNPIVMATQATSSNFTHNIWLNDAGTHVFTTDEVSGANVDAYDVSDLTDIQQVDLWQSNPGSGVIVHNTFVLGNFIVTSYYRDGITITDVTFPDNMIQTGFYDTSPLSGDNFNGCWGVYPYLPSGNILATDIEEGLFVLGPTYVQAAYLQGNVIDSVTMVPISGAEVEITGVTADLSSSDISGDYSAGSASAGTVSVTFSKLGYNPKTISGVTITNGVITTVDAELVALPSFAMNGVVLDSITGIAVPFAKVLFESPISGVYQLTADASGAFSLSSFLEGTYEVYAGQWNFRTKRINSVSLDDAAVPYTIEINKGLYDDFIFDFAWTTLSTASTGLWIRDEPIGTTSGPSQSNPEFDVSPDFGDKAYITGNAGGGAGTDDVDDGVVTLLSPIFDLTPYGDPHISFSRWFYNGGGSGFPNDSLVLYLNNGTDEEIIDLVINGDFTESSWAARDIRVIDFMTPTAEMLFIVRAMDVGDGHLSEGGLDFWQVYDASLSGPPVAALGVMDSICSPGMVSFEDLSTENPISWFWEFTGASPAISTEANPEVMYSTPGTYDVILTVYNGIGTDAQTFLAAVVIPEIMELSGIGVNSTTGSDGSVSVSIIGGTAPYDIQWDDPAEQTSETAVGLGGGTYTAIVTDANGCMQTVNVVLNGPANGISPIQGVALSIGANPFIEQTTLGWTENLTGEILWTAFDVLGRIIENGNLSGTQGLITIGEAWPVGMINIEFSSKSKKVGSARLIKH